MKFSCNPNKNTPFTVIGLNGDIPITTKCCVPQNIHEREIVECDMTFEKFEEVMAAGYISRGTEYSQINDNYVIVKDEANKAWFMPFRKETGFVVVSNMIDVVNIEGVKEIHTGSYTTFEIKDNK